MNRCCTMNILKNIKLQKKKTSSAFTLLELIIAIGIMAVVTIPIYGLFVTGVRVNAQAHRNTVAALTAQQKLEEYVGLNFDEIKLRLDPPDADGNPPSPKEFENENGFDLKVSYEIFHKKNNEVVLIKLTVDVYTLNTATSIYKQSDILNVISGGSITPELSPIPSTSP